MHYKTTPINSYSWKLGWNLALSFLLATTAQAAVQHPLNDLKVIEVTISKQGLTRIAVKEDRILNVFGITGEYILEADEDQGQIFIRPSELNGTKPINLTLTTEGGHTQDLRLLPQDKNPEALILMAEDKTQKNPFMRDGITRDGVPHNGVTRDEVPRNEVTRNGVTHNGVTRDGVEDLMQACREGNIPLGYRLVPVPMHEKDNLKIPPHVLVRELRGEKLRCLAYAVKNTSSLPLKLENKDFAQVNETVAVLIPQKTLAPGKKGEAYVVARSY